MTSSQVPASLPALTSDLVRLSAIPSISAPGYTVFPGMVTSSGDLVILAVQRQGEDVGETELAEGDTLLLQASWAALDETSTTRACASSC